MLIILMCDVIFHFLWLQKHILWYGRDKLCIYGQSVIFLKTLDFVRKGGGLTMAKDFSKKKDELKTCFCSHKKWKIPSHLKIISRL